MRPAILFPLFAEIRTLSGVRPKLANAQPGRIATVEVNVLEHRPNRVKAQPYRVIVSDDSALMDLVFFRSHAEYLAGILPAGARRVVSGRIERFKDRLQMAHPDYVVPPEKIAELP